ncbi:MAG TPA: DUF481 domain-containing protein [Steroidobacteraceae bacterium]|nr:DUF481 domain-containing protein [Steroidobacteraceae bacterium]
MRLRIVKVVFPLLGLIASSAVLAQAPSPAAPAAPAAPAPPPPWLINAQAGYVSSKGNTNATTANVKLDVVHQYDVWKHELSLQYVYGTQNGYTNAERLDAMWQSNYNFSGRLYVFGQLVFDDDQFNGFEYQGTASAGLGYSIFKTAATMLNVQLGAGYSRMRPMTLIDDANGNVVGHTLLPVQDETVATTTIDFTHQFNAATKLLETLYVQSGDLDTLLKNDLGLQVSMSKSLSLTAGYEIRLNTNPPVGTERKDTLITLNLTYTRK